MTPLLAVAGLVGMVWLVVFLTRGSLIAGCLAFLVSRCVFNVYFAEFSVGPTSATVDRLVFAGLVAAFALQTLLSRTESKPRSWADVLLVVYLGYFAITAFGLDAPVSVPSGDPQPVARYMAGYLIPAFVYWIARNAQHSSRSVTCLLAGLSGFGLYLGITALLEAGHHWGLVFPAHIADPEAGIHFGRARGPMVQAVSMGLYLSVTAFAAWLWSGQLRGFGRWAVLALVPLSTVGLFFTYTRSCWMGAGAIVLIVLTLRTRGLFRLWLLGGLAAATILLGLTKWDSLMGFQRETSSAVTRDSAKLRPMFAYVSWEMFLDRPIFGCGFGHYFETKNEYLNDNSTPLALNWIRSEAHHNRALNLLAETGVIGLGLFAGFWAVVVAKAWRLWSHVDSPSWARGMGLLFLGGFAAYLLQILFHDLTYSQQDNALAMVMAGMVVGVEATVLPVTRATLASLSGTLAVLRSRIASPAY